MTVCVGFVWDNFLPKCGAVFWAHAENSFDNSGMFPHCWSGLAQSQGLFGSSPLQHCTMSWERTADPSDQGDSAVWFCAQHIKLWEEGGGREYQEWHFCLPKTSLCVETWFSWRWLSIFLHMEVVNKYLVSLCSHVWLLLFLLNCPYLKPWVFSHFYPSNSVPHPTGSEWMSICVELSFHLGLNLDTVKYKLWKIHSQPWRQNSGYMPWKKIVFESTNTCTFHIWGNRPIKGLLLMPKNRKCLVLFMHLQSDL